jgi:hypothetical protein
MTILIIVAALLAVLLFLLLTPIVIELDTTRNLYEVRLTAIAKVFFIYEDAHIGIRMRILGFETSIFPRKKSEPKKEKAPKQGKRMKLSPRKAWHKGSAIARSFMVRQFYLNIDTDDYAMNALLYPVAAVLSKGSRQFRINFNGDVALHLKITNSMQRILRAYFF